MREATLEFAQKMRAKRRANKHTQTEAARVVGVYESTFRAWEHGRVPTVGTIFRVADYLDTTVDELRPLLEEPPDAG